MLAAAVSRGMERQDRARQNNEERVRDVILQRVADIYVPFFEEIDFDVDRLTPREIIDQRVWDYARDAYITNRPLKVLGRVLPGDVELNPLGAPDIESERLRGEALELVEAAYTRRETQRRGEVLAIPLYSGAMDGRGNGQREVWGAAYVRVALPSLDPLADPIDLRLLALSLGTATMALLALLYLMLHVLVLRPLSSVTAGALRVSAGDFRQPVSATGRGDEIDALIATFNGMMAEIDSARVALERRVEEALARTRATEKRLVLSERLAAMGTLAAGIAHEINNPVGGMINAVASLRRKQSLDPKSTDRYLALVEDGLQRVREVVQRVLRFSPARRSSGPVPVRALVEDAARFVRHRFSAESVALEVEVAPELAVAGDAAALGQVLLNLLVNAIDACGGVAHERRSVRVTGRADGAVAEIDVCDTGAGMTSEQLDRAFDLFYTTKEAGAGTGLGLSIVHQIVTEHGGTISLASGVGSGSTVRLRLPRAGNFPVP